MTAVAIRDAARAETPPAGAPASRQLPHVPLIVCLTSLGFLLCVVANALSRATLTPPHIIFWAGLLLIVAPTAYRLTAPDPTRRERLFLACLLGMALYAVKLARDPTMFSYPDELVHAYNALSIVRTEALFGLNPILPATPYYPGLEGATSGLMQTAGLSVFSAGVLVVGLARLIMVVALFVLFECVSGSARVAGIGVVAYAANANFLYFNAQYSYESLSLPLLVAVLACVALWQRSDWFSWRLPIWLGTAAVVVTHHLTSYALAGALLLIAVIQRALRRWRDRPNPWVFAALAIGLAAFWLVFIGEAVIDYLAPVFGRAVESVQATVSGEAAARPLFKAKATAASGTDVPSLERAISLSSVAVFALLMPLGLRHVWRRHRLDAMAILLALAAVAYFGTLGLRLVPSAWEVGNRASAFLFVGLGFVIGCAGLEKWSPQAAPRLGRMLVTGALALGVMGGFIAGWPTDIRLSQPLVVEADGRRIQSEPLAMAGWLSDELPGRRFAATVTDARAALVHGRVLALAGARPDVQDMLYFAGLQPWMLEMLREYRLRYVIANRRKRSIDVSRALTFQIRHPVGRPDIFRPADVVDKFERLGGTRVYDSGHIVVFDLGERVR